jgi:hypothetical protein
MAGLRRDSTFSLAGRLNPLGLGGLPRTQVMAVMCASRLALRASVVLSAKGRVLVMKLSGTVGSTRLGQVLAMQRAEIIARPCAGASVVPQARLRSVRRELNLAAGTSHVTFI